MMRARFEIGLITMNLIQIASDEYRSLALLNKQVANIGVFIVLPT